jgi:hypothetical protein
MNPLRFSPRALGLCGIVAMLAGCGGTQTAMNSAVPHGVPAESREREASGSSGDLLYALGARRGRWTLHAFTFPGGQQVSSQPVNASRGLCSDTSGNIFIPRYEGVDEYAHGGKQPIATLGDPNYAAVDCSVDPATGNLAVTNESRQTSPGNVVVYENASGSPTAYTDPQIYYYLSCGYDNSGNLFVVGATKASGEMLAELPNGSSTFINITVDRPIYVGSVQWDGNYVALMGDQKHIYRVQISGSTGTVVQTILLRHTRGINEFWIQGNIIAATSWNSAIYNYPRGGKPILFFSHRGHLGVHLYGVTVSVAPSGRQKRK